jgi:hypothetical protein
MHAAGIRGARFTHIIGRTGKRNSGTLDLSDLKVFAPRLRVLGWHAQLWANCEVIAANASWLSTLGVPLVLDHLCVVDVSRGVDNADFQSVLQLVRDDIAWVKLTAFRTLGRGHSQRQMRESAQRIIKATHRLADNLQCIDLAGQRIEDQFAFEPRQQLAHAHMDAGTKPYMTQCLAFDVESIRIRPLAWIAIGSAEKHKNLFISGQWYVANNGCLRGGAKERLHR